MFKLFRLIILLGLLAIGFLLIGPGLPFGKKADVATSGSLTFPYEVSQKLRLNRAGPELIAELSSTELLQFLSAEFASAKIHRKVSDQRITSLEFSGPRTALAQGEAKIQLNKYLETKVRFSATILIDHSERDLIVTYDININNFPGALEKPFARRIGMEKRLPRDCLKIRDIRFEPNSQYALSMSASCNWGEIF